MSQNIHPTAIIGDGVKLGSGVCIGPFCHINGDVTINDGSRLVSHVVILAGAGGKATIGKNNTFHPFTCIGNVPQDLKFKNEQSVLEIGDNNTFRENVTVHIGTEAGGFYTKIGSGNLLMVGTHIAHDVIMGNDNILSNSVGVAGHVKIGNRVVIGGMTGIHQFCEIGDVAMIGGFSALRGNVPPFAMILGDSVRGVNIIGMTRKGYSKSDINVMMKIYRRLFVASETGSNFGKRLSELKKDYSDSNVAGEFFAFIEKTANSKMSLCKGKDFDN